MFSASHDRRRTPRIAAVLLLIMTLAVGLMARGSPTVNAASFGSGDVLVVDTDVLNLRDFPSLDGDIILTMEQGEEVVVVDGPTSADGYRWYKVSYGASTVGWAAGEYLAGASSDNPLEPGTHDENFPVGAVVMVDTDRLNFRVEPGLDADIIRVLTYETVALVDDGPVSENGYHWYQISLGSSGSGAQGWAIGEGLAMLGGAGIPDGAYAFGDVVMITSDRVNLRAAPGLGEDILEVLPNGAKGEVTDGPVAADGYDWYKLSSSAYGEGWVAGDYIALDYSGASFNVGDTVHVVDGRLNLRAAGSTSSNVIAVMEDGTELTIINGPGYASGYTWYRVTSDEYGTGWAAGEYLALSD